VEWPAVTYAPMPGLPTITIEPIVCGLGEEPTPETFIGHMVLVMREMWRVLRDDGTCWVNLGDSFAGSGGAGGDYAAGGIREGQPKFKTPKSALRAKSKILIPHRFALAMQSEGWIVRQDIVWAKGVSCLPDYAGSCMPESTRDRPTTGHEYLFLLSKNPKYFYDKEAVSAPAKSAGKTRIALEISGSAAQALQNGRTPSGNGVPGTVTTYAPTRNLRSVWAITYAPTRNLRSVWVINPGSYPGAHFATFPERLPELCILAGTSAKGVCPECGAPWERVVEHSVTKLTRGEQPWTVGSANGGQPQRDAPGGMHVQPFTTTGWAPTCTCNAAEPIPATVLDPFNGSGTTGAVATKHGRDYIGIDLSDNYFEQAHERIGQTPLMFPGFAA
jgi:DNA modification methylase